MSIVCSRGTPTMRGNRLRAKREHLETFYGRLPESQGQNLALTVLYVLDSLSLDGCDLPQVGRRRLPPQVLSLSLSLSLSLPPSLSLSLSLSRPRLSSCSGTHAAVHAFTLTTYNPPHDFCILIVSSLSALGGFCTLTVSSLPELDGFCILTCRGGRIHTHSTPGCPPSFDSQVFSNRELYR